jgi:hypothetical protein
MTDESKCGGIIRNMTRKLAGAANKPYPNPRQFGAPCPKLHAAQGTFRVTRVITPIPYPAIAAFGPSHRHEIRSIDM